MNARSSDILSFLNAGGGLFAMSESNLGAMLTPSGGHFGFLPFVQSETKNQSGAGHVLTAFGASLGFQLADITGDFTHGMFVDDYGFEVVDFDSSGDIISLAGRGRLGPGGPIPEPSTMLLLPVGAFGLYVFGSKRKGSTRGPTSWPDGGFSRTCATVCLHGETL